MPEPVDHAAVRSAYDTVAETYAKVLPDLGFESAEDLAMIQRFVTEVDASPDRKVFDAGCGTGRLAAHLRNAGLNVTGVDLSPTMVRVARRLNPKIEFTAGELTALPADGGSADGVVSWYSIIHLERDAIDAVAFEFARVLRAGRRGAGRLPGRKRLPRPDARVRARRRAPRRAAQPRRRHAQLRRPRL